MFFNSIDEIPKIIAGVSCAIFVVPPETELKLKNTIFLRPEKDKKTIPVEQMRDFLSLTGVKQNSDQFFVITPADKMGAEAQNAFLKTLEEPHDNYHFILLTEKPDLLLPTILSRTALFILKKTNTLKEPPDASEEVKTLAKRLIAAKPADLIEIAEGITKKKDTSRAKALDVVGVAIEILYKTYFITGNTAFLAKLPKFLKLYENLEQNGHVKLHLVADLC